MPSRQLRVTAAITSHTQEPFLRATLESVLAQTRQPDEIIVVDAASRDDGTPNISGRYDSRVRVVQEPNAGPARARNRAVREATGDLVALLDCGDLWMPHKLERCLDAAQAAIGTRVVVHDIERESETAGRVFKQHPTREFLARVGHQDSRNVVIDCWPLLTGLDVVWTTAQLLVDRSLYLDVGGSDPRFHTAGDYDLYLRLAERTGFLIVPEILTRARQHELTEFDPDIHQYSSWMCEVVNVLRSRADTTEAFRVGALRVAAATTLSNLTKYLYRREETEGSWHTARSLFRVAAECRAPTCAALAIAVLTPRSLRRAAARVTGVRPL